jgi:hypothetical protein
MSGRRIFKQLVEVYSTSPEDLKTAFLEWEESVDEPGVTARVSEDLESPNWYIAIMRYPSREVAQRLAETDVTKYLYKKLSSVCTDGPYIRNLEVI